MRVPIVAEDSCALGAGLASRSTWPARTTDAAAGFSKTNRLGRLPALSLGLFRGGDRGAAPHGGAACGGLRLSRLLSRGRSDLGGAPLSGGVDGALCGEDPALESGEGTLRFGRRCGARPPLRPRGASTASSPPSVFSRFADLPLHMPGALTASSFALAAMSFIACPKRASFSLRLGLDVVLLGWSARATVVFRDIKHATPLRQGIAAGAAESFRDPPGFGTPTSW